MIHARIDYNRFQDPEGKIGEDEPVILFRAQDEHFIQVLAFYLAMVGADEDMRAALSIHICRAHAWQEAHGCKRPDMPFGCVNYEEDDLDAR